MSFQCFGDELRVLDGGSGYEALELCGGKLDISSHKCWSARLLHDDQDAVREVYRRFLEAGAEVITSMSYQASPANLSASFGISEAAAEQLMVDSVLLAKAEIERHRSDGPPSATTVLSAASIGPYGAHLADGSEYSGAYIDCVPLQRIRETYERQIWIMASAKPDLLAFETVPTLAELRLIVDAMRERPNERAWISMSIAIGGDGVTLTAHGEPIDVAIEYVNRHAAHNIFAFGVNCIMPLRSVRRTLSDIRSKLDPSKLLIVYPNSGEMWDRPNDRWYYPEGVDANTFYEELPFWIEAGARWIGGCCMMGSGRMKRVSEIVRSFRAKGKCG